MMSFWIVPLSFFASKPRSSATTRYIAKRIHAEGLIVIETLIFSRSMPAYRSCMSSTLSTATPSRPTSPSLRTSSESYPMSVGMSKSVEMPVWPCPIRKRKRPFVSSAVPKPAIWRIVHGAARYIVG
jgi:hypothetical protein